MPWRGNGGRWRLWALPTYEEDAVVISPADDGLPGQGDSGGPLVTAARQVIGMDTARPAR